MKEIPIPFTSEMLRAILDQRKTQTRRVIKFLSEPGYTFEESALDTVHRELASHNGHPGIWIEYGIAADDTRLVFERCPYGHPGDLLWVRETWKPGAWDDEGRVAVDYKASPELTKTPWMYPSPEQWDNYWRAWTDELLAAGSRPDNDGRFHWEPGKSPLKWRPSIHMPKWACRLWLEVTGVRVERVQEITEADAQWEGWDWSNLPEGYAYDATHHARDWFKELWDSINAKRGHPFSDNPWVWVVEFKIAEPAAIGA